MYEWPDKNVRPTTRSQYAMFNLPPPPGFLGLDEHRPVTFYHRHLPHWRQDDATYFVTFRLADSLPQEKLRQLKAMRKQWEALHPQPRSEKDWEAFARDLVRKVDRWLDEGHGACYFSEERYAKVMHEALLYFQDQRYFASCWVIMPNHCHLVIRPFPGFSLEKILQVCKGYVAGQINRQLGTQGTFWQEESFNRIIRDEEHLWRVVQYIGHNPARAGIEPSRWWRWIHPEWERLGWRFEDQ